MCFSSLNFCCCSLYTKKRKLKHMKNDFFSALVDEINNGWKNAKPNMGTKPNKGATNGYQADLFECWRLWYKHMKINMKRRRGELLPLLNALDLRLNQTKNIMFMLCLWPFGHLLLFDFYLITTKLHLRKMRWLCWTHSMELINLLSWKRSTFFEYNKYMTLYATRSKILNLSLKHWMQTDIVHELWQFQASLTRGPMSFSTQSYPR